MPGYPANSGWPLLIARGIRKVFFVSIDYMIKILQRLKFRDSHIHKIIESTELESGFALNQQFYNSIASKKYVFIREWGFRPDEFTKDSLKSVLENTRFMPSFYADANRFIKEIYLKDHCVIGVHIRRGDYKNFEGGRFFYSYAEYSNWMMQIQTQFTQKTIFVVSSNDDLPKSGEFFDKALIFRPSPGHMITDLAVLSKCDYIIGPPSTFSMWASFIGNVPLQMIRTNEQVMQKENFKVYVPGEIHP
ncbi:MAG: hypothetical protein ACJASM_001672 [Salibacteraceae bacterium]